MRKSWREKAAWVAAMRWDEVRTRLRQEAQKRIERVAYGIGIDAAAREIEPTNARRNTRAAGRVAEPTRPANAQTGPPSAPRGQFFFVPGGVRPILSLLRERFPRQCEETIERAERICRHQFDLLGFEGLQYGKVIDWHQDPVNAKRAPRRPWYKLQSCAPNEVGDRRIIWEINRHQHLVTLAKAHLLAQESRYLTELMDEWHGWQKENSYPTGINWASGLEVAFRSLAWLWVGHLLSASPAAPKSFQHELVRALARSALRMERYLSIESSPEPNLPGEAVALFFIGTLCPRLRSAARWRELGWRIVVEQAAKQTPDGGIRFGPSVYYHVYTLDFYLHARILAACNHMTIPERFDRAIEGMLEFLSGISQAGSAPRFGDDDGGRVFDPRRNRREHMLDPLSTGAVLYDRGDFKSASGGLKEETVWLLGPEGVRQFDALENAPVSSSIAFPASGFYVMASMEPPGAPGPTGRRKQLVIGARPQGIVDSAHGHADALSVQVSVDGEEWLIDPGTHRNLPPRIARGSRRNPVDDPENGSDRERFRGTAAHNTLGVDGLSQAGLAERADESDPPRTEVEQWITGRQFDLFLGKHNGYAGLAHPVVHHRWVFHLKSQFWLVRDVMEGTGEHEVEISWHFAPDFVPSYTPPGFTLKRAAKGANPGMEKMGLAIVPPEAHGWSQEVCRGHVSPAYGVEEPAPVVRFQTRTRAPAEFATVLQPVAGGMESLGKLMRNGSSQATRYRYQTADAEHVFFFSDDGQPWELDGWKSDARFVYLSAGTSAMRLQLALCAGSFLETGCRQVLACDRLVERCEVISRGSHQGIYCSDRQAAINFTRGNLDAELL
ncbi:MAG: alginate lyase family protein [Terriglobia bacterium]